MFDFVPANFESFSLRLFRAMSHASAMAFNQWEKCSLEERLSLQDWCRAKGTLTPFFHVTIMNACSSSASLSPWLRCLRCFFDGLRGKIQLLYNYFRSSLHRELESHSSAHVDASCWMSQPTTSTGRGIGAGVLSCHIIDTLMGTKNPVRKKKFRFVTSCHVLCETRRKCWGCHELLVSPEICGLNLFRAFICKQFPFSLYWFQRRKSLKFFGTQIIQFAIGCWLNISFTATQQSNEAPSKEFICPPNSPSI